MRQAGWTGQEQQQQQQASGALMLARIAHEVYWLGRYLARAEHTARMLDGLFHADLQGRADDPATVDPVVGGAAGDHGRATRERRCRRSATRSCAC